MKKLILILVALVVAAPCVAGTITFGTVDNDDGTCTITYYVNGKPPVAMGLLVTADKNITAVTDIDEFFEIYMDYAYTVDPCYTYGDGHPIADPCAAGAIDLPQMKFVISMGGLGGATSPPTKFPKMGSKQNPATLCVLHSDTQPPLGGTTTGTITICPLRGGVIDEDAKVMDPNNIGSPGALVMPFVISECFPSGHADYAMWAKAVKPVCWCPTSSGVPGASDYQCKGDADGGFAGKDKDGARMWVTGPDLTILSAGWQKVDTEPGFEEWICADFDHAFGGKDKDGARMWVTGPDLTILSAGWQKIDTDAHFTTNPGVVMNPCFPIVIP